MSPRSHGRKPCDLGCRKISFPMPVPKPAACTPKYAGGPVPIHDAQTRRRAALLAFAISLPLAAKSEFG